jgi:hypothetical protein
MAKITARPWNGQTVGRIAATMGVILSLVFVGLELRQNRQVARAQLRQGLADGNAAVLSSIAENPELARAWTGIWTSPSPEFDLSLADTTQARMAMFLLLRHLENVYLQVLEGVVDESVLGSYGFRDNIYFTTPQFIRYWPTIRGRFDSRFAAALEAEYNL